MVENGIRTHWAAWIAWYYKSFNLLAQYDGGYQNYAPGIGSTRTQRAVDGLLRAGVLLPDGRTDQAAGRRHAETQLHHQERPDHRPRGASRSTPASASSISAITSSPPAWPTPTSGPTRRTPSTSASTGTRTSTPRSTSTGSTPSSATPVTNGPNASQDGGPGLAPVPALLLTSRRGRRPGGFRRDEGRKIAHEACPRAHSAGLRASRRARTRPRQPPTPAVVTPPPRTGQISPSPQSQRSRIDPPEAQGGLEEAPLDQAGGEARDRHTLLGRCRLDPGGQDQGESRGRKAVRGAHGRGLLAQLLRRSLGERLGAPTGPGV